MLVQELVEKRIVKRGSKWCVVSEHGGKNLGCSSSKAGAHKRLGQVEYFKHAHKSLTEEGIVAALDDGTLSATDAQLKAFDEYLEAKSAFHVGLGYNEIPLVTITTEGNPVPTAAHMIMYRDMIGTAGWSADGLRDVIVANGAKLSDVLGVWYSVKDARFLVSFATKDAEKTLGALFGEGLKVDYEGFPEGQPGVVTIYKSAIVDKYILDGVHFDDVPLGMTKNFTNEGDAQHWLSTFRLVPVISDSTLDVVGGRYAYCGVVYGTDTGGVVKATLTDATKLPLADIESGKAHIYGAGGILRKHLPGRHDQQAHAGGGGAAAKVAHTPTQLGEAAARQHAKDTGLSIVNAKRDLEMLRKEHKHLPGKHDQLAHGHMATNKEVRAGMNERKSSLEGPLRGKDFEGKIIRNIRDVGEKEIRLVIFKDGTGLYVPTPALMKMAFGHGGKGEAGKTFKTAAKLHAGGFVSWVQANYLLASKPAVYWQLREDATSGKRVWDTEAKHFIINQT